MSCHDLGIGATWTGAALLAVGLPITWAAYGLSETLAALRQRLRLPTSDERARFPAWPGPLLATVSAQLGLVVLPFGLVLLLAC
jgi:hypothetical protein